MVLMPPTKTGADFAETLGAFLPLRVGGVCGADGERIPRTCSRIEPLNRVRSSASILPRRGNEFSLSPGERAGVRVSVKLFSSRCFQSFTALDLARRFMERAGVRCPFDHLFCHEFTPLLPWPTRRFRPWFWTHRAARGASTAPSAPARATGPPPRDTAGAPRKSVPSTSAGHSSAEI